MKRLLLLPVLFVSFGISSQVLYWSNEIFVNANQYSNMHPRIALTSGNIPVVLWGGGNSTEPLYVSRWNGTMFGMPVVVTPANVDPFIDNWAGPSIAANGNDVFIVFKMQPEMMSYIYSRKSSDGGLNWLDTVRVDGMQGPTTRFPTIAVSPNGNPLIMFMEFNASWQMPEYVVTNSPDGGATWPMAINISNVGSSEVCDCCPAGLISEGNRQIGGWRRNNNNLRDMWIGKSTDAGVSFPTGGDVDNGNWIVSLCPSTGPELFIRNDSLITVWMSQTAGVARIQISSYHLNTDMIGFNTQLAPNFPSMTTQNYAQIAGNLDTMGVVWQQQDMSGNIESFFTYSTTGASGMVNNEMALNNNSSGEQRNPDIAYSAGKFHMVFQDNSTNRVVYKTASFYNVGDEELENSDPNISLFPNPAQNNVTVFFNGGNNATLNLLDLSGKQVIHITDIGSGKVKLDLSNIAKGVYFVEVVKDNRKKEVKKLVVY